MAKMKTSTCIVCRVDFISDQKNDPVNSEVSPEKVFEIICEYFTLFESQNNGLLWDFKSDGSPLCKTCHQTGGDLLTLQTQLESTQHQILKIIAQISSKILDPPQSTSSENLDEIIARKVFRFQSLVREQYTPQLALLDCRKVSGPKIRSRGKKKVSKDDLHTDNPSPSSSPLSILYPTSAQDMEVECNFHSDRSHSIKQEVVDGEDVMNNYYDESLSSTEDGQVTIESDDDQYENEEEQVDDEDNASSDVDRVETNEHDAEGTVTSEDEDSPSSSSSADMKEDKRATEEPRKRKKVIVRSSKSTSSVETRKGSKVEDNNNTEISSTLKPKSQNCGGGRYLYAGKYGFMKIGTNGAKCETCGLVLKFRTHIYRHIQDLHMGLQPTKIKCPICSKLVANLKAFKGHLSNVHLGVHSQLIQSKVITCGRDGFLFDGKWYFVKTTEGLFTCGSCGDYTCGSQDELLQHIHITHQNDQLTCPDCGKEGFLSKRALVGHQNNMHSSRKDKKKKYESTKNKIKTGTNSITNKKVTAKKKPENIKTKSVNCGNGRYSFAGKYGYVKISKTLCTCNNCGLEIHQNHILRHIRLKHMALLQTKFSCSTCGKSLSNLQNFLSHQATFHPEIDFKSNLIVCGDGKFLIYGLFLFEKTEEGGGFKCEICDDIIDNQDDCLEHVQTSHQDERLTCDICNKDFLTKRSLVSHKICHEESKKKKLGGRSGIVQNSEQQFVYRGKWKFEQVEGGGFKCLTCGIFFLNKNGMQNHLKHSHDDPTPDSGVYLYNDKWPYEKVDSGFQCLTCGSRRKLKGCMEQHIRERHIDPNRYVCDLCGKSFSAKQSFEYHQAKHSSLRLHMCEECGSRFRNKDELRQHKLSHKQWQCTDCNKTFEGKFGKSNMYHHRKRWHSSRKLECHNCHKTFLYKSELTQHLATHIGNDLISIG